MKTLLTAAMTVMLLAGSAVLADSNRSDSHRDRGRDQASRHFNNDRHNDGRGRQQSHRSDRNDRHDSNVRRFSNDRHDRNGGRDWNRNDGRHDNARHFNNDHRDNRFRDHRWDNDRNRHWNDRRDWRPSRYNDYPRYGGGYRSYGWHRGARIPATYFSTRYIVSDYGAYRLSRPPRGYRWIRVDSDLLLVAIATGLVVDIVVGSW